MASTSAGTRDRYFFDFNRANQMLHVQCSEFLLYLVDCLNAYRKVPALDCFKLQ